jgi:hypothetical protein
MKTDFLSTAKKQFEYYKLLGEKTFEQLNEEQLLFIYKEDSNSIAIIVNHLHGNMLSRWTNFLTTDGEKETRNRDGEFENGIKTKNQLIERWNAGWKSLFDTLNSLTETDLEKTIYIRNQGCSVMDAIIRQLAHYPYHVGQIVFIGKMLTNNNWKSLSIPKNSSKDYNANKFSQPKHDAHFTDEYLKKKQ